MVLSQIFEYEPRQRKKCSVCDKVRLTTRAMWMVELNEIHHIEVHLCNECLAKT